MIKWLEQAKEWAGWKSIFAIKRSAERDGKISEEVNFYISSLKKSAQELMQYPREHWKIESMHWMLDNIYNEDCCYFKGETTHVSFYVFKKLSFSIHKAYMQREKRNLSSSMRRCLVNESRLHDVLVFLFEKYTD